MRRIHKCSACGRVLPLRDFSSNGRTCNRCDRLYGSNASTRALADMLKHSGVLVRMVHPYDPDFEATRMRFDMPLSVVLIKTVGMKACGWTHDDLIAQERRVQERIVS